MRYFRLTDFGRPRVGRPSPLRRRRGAIVVLSAVLMIVMMALLALSIDTGYMFTMQTQLDRAVDAAALAGAAVLIDGEDQAEQTALEYLIRNPVAQPTSILTSNELVELTAEFIAEHSNDYEILWGSWNPVTHQVEQTGEIPSALEVTMTYPNLPLFFGRVLGKSHFDVHSRAVAMYQPRDIMLVLDFSASMNDDSEFGAISQFGKPTIMAGLQTIYEELDTPVYGNMVFDPKYITVSGRPPGGADQPQISMEYRYRSVSVQSTLASPTWSFVFPTAPNRRLAACPARAACSRVRAGTSTDRSPGCGSSRATTQVERDRTTASRSISTRAPSATPSGSRWA